MKQQSIHSCRKRWTMKTNQSVLNETVLTQKQTRGALERIQRQIADTTAIGLATLESMQENNHRINQVTKESKQLNQKLKQTDKLQNRLSKWTFQLQNRREGRTLAKKELKDEKLVLNVDQEINLWPLAEHRVPAEAKSQEGTTRDSFTAADKLEIFSGRLQGSQEGYATSMHKRPPKPGTPLSDAARLLLDQIEQNDQDMDPLLDSLGVQMEYLLAISTTLGETTEVQSSKLTIVEQELQRADYKQKLANHRGGLFTKTQAEKSAEKQLHKRVIRASKLHNQKFVECQ
jgi:hypothetical protein